jgi:CDP-paratose synthetase
MNIAVTGGSGFIGRHLCARLRKENIPFVCLVRPSTDRSFFEENNIHYVSFDLGDATLADAFRDLRLTGVVHLASKFVAEHSRHDIDDLIGSNIRYGTHILDACTQAGIKWFLNTGTFWQHYNGADYDPVNLYAATKQAFEDIAKFYAEAYGLRFCTLKLCDTYGPGDTRKKIFNLFQQIALSGEVLEMSAGEQLIDIVHVDQVVSAFLKLIHQLARSTDLTGNCDSYYVSSGWQVNLKELAREYEVTNSVKLNIKWGARPYRSREVMLPACIGTRIITSSPAAE